MIHRNTLHDEECAAAPKVKRVGSWLAVLRQDIAGDAAFGYFSKSQFEDKIRDSGPPTQHFML